MTRDCSAHRSIVRQYVGAARSVETLSRVKPKSGSPNRMARYQIRGEEIDQQAAGHSVARLRPIDVCQSKTRIRGEGWPRLRRDRKSTPDQRCELKVSRAAADAVDKT